jgi:hypothetical protein
VHWKDPFERGDASSGAKHSDCQVVSKDENETRLQLIFERQSQQDGGVVTGTGTSRLQ